MNKLLLFGINDYPGTINDLQGCLNDVNLVWDKFALEFSNLSVTIFEDNEVTKENFINWLNNVFKFEAQKDDWIIIYYSGHGTQVIDKSGDEPDGYDEALYLYDGPLVDDEIREVCKLIPEDVHVVFILDSCFSGMATKAAGDERIRFVKTDKITKRFHRKKAFLKDTPMVEAVFSACDEDEYSYEDVMPDGKVHGVFTYYLCEALEKGKSLEEIITDIYWEFPYDEYPQYPQLDGSSKVIESTLLEPMLTTGIGDIPVEPEQPQPTKPLLIIRILSAIIRFIINLFK